MAVLCLKSGKADQGNFVSNDSFFSCAFFIWVAMLENKILNVINFTVHAKVVQFFSWMTFTFEMLKIKDWSCHGRIKFLLFYYKVFNYSIFFNNIHKTYANKLFYYQSSSSTSNWRSKRFSDKATRSLT